MTMWDRIRRLARAPLGDILSGLTILGLLLYSVSWLAYRGIYEKLGLHAQDVGLTYSSILSTTALGIVVLTTVMVFALLIVGLLAGSEEEARAYSRMILPDSQERIGAVVADAAHGPRRGVDHRHRP
jgi:hypothetical protein